jgi:hypothetical protein
VTVVCVVVATFGGRVVFDDDDDGGGGGGGTSRECDVVAVAGVASVDGMIRRWGRIR